MFTKLILGFVLSTAVFFAGARMASKEASPTNADGDEAVASCCSSAVQTGDKADCCKKNLACCDKGKTRACCVATTKIGCCAKGQKCCENNAACCSSVQECCRVGAACCDEGKACCGKKANH